jgi:hypothetical protein
MVKGRVSSLAVGLAALLVLGGVGSAAATTQPSYDTVRVAVDGTSAAYQVWVAWAPLLLNTPDGGAWAFFSAQAQTANGYGSKKLYASHFDPKTGVWQPATAMPGGVIQFGPTGVVDAKGVVHVIYSDRAKDDPTSYSTLMYTTSTADGGWTDPVPVAPNDQAGHQLAPSLALDAAGGMHLAWQDQRGVSDEMRTASASNADIFACDLAANGTCAKPVLISIRETPTTNGSRPDLVVDGDRLVVVWSTYVGTSDADLQTAQRVEWSTRPLADANATWTKPQTIVERENGLIGGRLVDLAADPNGGVYLAFGRRTTANALYLTHMAKDAKEWSDPLIIASGDRGSFPALVVAGDGTAYVSYNIGDNTDVQVGAVALGPGQPRASAETMVSRGEDGAQGRPVITIDASGRVWILYMHEPTGGVANEVRVQRGATIPSEPAAETPATPVPATPVASPAATPAT